MGPTSTQELLRHQVPENLHCCSADIGSEAGVDLRDGQIAAGQPTPRTTMRYDRARTNLDRHPSCILTAYMASGT